MPRRRKSPPVAILNLIDCLNPGGTERQLIEQCRALDRQRWRPLIATFHTQGTLLPEVEALKIAVGEFPLRTRLLHPNTAVQITRLVRHCRQNNVAIIHAHDFYANLIGSVVARISHLPLIVSRRDLAHWLSPAKRAALGLVCRSADRVIANAQAVATTTTLDMNVALERVRLVPNGINLRTFDRRSAEPLSEPLPKKRGQFTVAVISNLNLPDKGHGDLLEATALLTKRNRQVQILLVGAGAEESSLRAQVGWLGLQDNVHFLGRRYDVPALLRRVDAVCLPSWAEGFPNAILEAMAARKPVVATNVGGCGELLRDGITGLLVTPHSPVDLAKAIESLIVAPKKSRALGKAARAAVAAKYSIERSAEVLDRVYRELA